MRFVKKIIFSLVVASFCLLNSTCKKPSKFKSVNMYGLWVTNEGYCSHYFIEIKRNNHGTYAPYSPDKGCNGKTFKGIVKISNRNLYIGHTKMWFLEEPTYYSKNDSIEWMDSRPKQNYKILATMKVELSFFHGHDTYTFKKIEDY